MKTISSVRSTTRSEGVQQKKIWRVVIADDEAINRMGLRFLLESCGDAEIVAEACNGAEALQKTIEYTPDIVLMDLTMPEMDGIATTRAIRKIMPAVKILVLTSVKRSTRDLRCTRSRSQRLLPERFQTRRLHDRPECGASRQHFLRFQSLTILTTVDEPKAKKARVVSQNIGLRTSIRP